MATLIGGDGDDVLTLGGTGSNTLSGGLGNDALFGGDGADFFDFDIDTLTGLDVGIDVMQGGDGNDSYTVDNVSDQVVETDSQANGGGVDIIFSKVSYTLSTNVENLTLVNSAANGTGNSLVNIIVGTNTANTLNGGAGADTLDGGSGGSDTFIVDNALDRIIGVSIGVDEFSTVISSVAYDLSAGFQQNAFIANITLTGTSAIDAIGNGRANVLIGNAASNTLDGGTGNGTVVGDANDTLDGGGGADRMIGGDGDDTYYVDNAGDVVVEQAIPNAGSDTIKSSITTDLRLGNYTNVENLILTGTANLNAIATDFGNAITGNSGRNTITGGAGADIISGGTNTGTAGDRMVGGGGDDTFIIFNANDVVIEGVLGGTDQLAVFTNFSLSSAALAGQEIEDLTLLGSAVFGTGNALVNVIVGNSLNNTLDGRAGADTMVGGDGDDFFIVDELNDFVDEILDQGNDTVSAGFTYALTTFVENLILTGTADINGTGNIFDNTITGNAGSNILDGAAGADSMIGGLGNDTYIVDEIGDFVTEIAGQGNDTVQSIISYTLDANIENLTLGGAIAIDGTGNSLANTILGNAAANTIDGGAGVDLMSGGDGDDFYFADVSGDVIVDTTGVDTVSASASYTIGTGIENLVLTGTTDATATGNAGVNTISGNDGNNLIDGGAGADRLIGGFGNDTYTVDNIGDAVAENLGEGTDTVNSSVTYTLSANVENLTLTGASAIDGTGNAEDNTLEGNSAANTLTGGLGNDVYVVDVLDTIVEGVGAGTDTAVFTSAVAGQTYTLGGNIENLLLGGTAAINGTGDATANTITGNAAANTLDGADGNDTLIGGAGADLMIGGTGNDTFIVDSTTDVVSEAAGGAAGNDTVVTNATFNLSTNAANIENLTLSGALAINGTGDLNINIITGNGAKNILSGLAGADTLDGGLGADTLIGGLGNDIFIIDNIGDKVTEAAGEGVDTVRSSLATYTLAANAENLELTGTANISGTGNVDANTLTGNTGNNTLNGGAGADRLIGGAGDDFFVIDNAGDSVIELGGEGTDTVQSAFAVDLTSGAFANVENLLLTGTSSINGTGTAGNNTLTGNSGLNTLTGGAGDDTYVASSNDVIVELAGGGNDTLIVTVTGTFVIPAFIENVLFAGTGAGNAIGNTDTNTLTGGAGNNTLDGGGGADLLAGGKGSDVYIADTNLDVVVEGLGEGTDTVRSTASYALSDNVENLVLLGTASIDGTGNNLNNTITGNSGNNTLDGGTGTDRLVGGAGNDTYIVDNIRDVIADTSGNDTVLTDITYTLSLASLENLTLTGAADVNGTGNSVVNILTGNSGANILNGGASNDTLLGGDGNDLLIGGTGADIMNGGDDDDSYIVDNVNDLIVDVTGEGVDSLTTTVSYTLSSTAEIEAITLGGTAAINFTGSDSDNTITGNAGANSIAGGSGNDTITGLAGNDILSGGLGDDILSGGAGADRMTGGDGADTFIFESASALLNVDVITDLDFQNDNDIIDLSDVLSGVYDPLADVLSDFVRINNSGGNSILQIDIDGAGAGTAAWKTIATLQDITGLTGVQALVDSGNLIVS